MTALAEVAILTPHGTAAPAGQGGPAQLFVSEELLGLAGSSPLRH
ncbi:MAG: hypothetical protein ACYDEN_01900 [Acidimicrobiales bacterium]